MRSAIISTQKHVLSTHLQSSLVGVDVVYKDVLICLMTVGEMEEKFQKYNRSSLDFGPGTKNTVLCTNGRFRLGVGLQHKLLGVSSNNYVSSDMC